MFNHINIINKVQDEFQLYEGITQNMTQNQNMSISAFLQNAIKNTNSAEEKLQQTLQAVVSFFGVTSAACWFSVDDNTLELVGFAGLAQNMPQTLRTGEGLSGEVALERRVLAQSKNSDHPQSVLAAPMLRWGKLYGVLSIFDDREHQFFEKEFDEITIAALALTHILASDELAQYRKKLARVRGLNIKEFLRGISLSKGYGVGHAVVHQRKQALVDIFSKDPSKEHQRFENAQALMDKNLEEKFNAARLGIGEHTDILETYTLMARDKGWIKRILGHIEKGLTAEAAVERAYEDMWTRLSASGDSYFRERLHDLRDIADRLRMFLSGDVSSVQEQDYKDIIVVAQSMGPADLMDYDHTKIRGLIIEDGTPTMHVCIVARALNIPVVAKIKGIFQEIKEGALLAVDGQEGVVYVHPTEDIAQKFRALQKNMALILAQLQKLKRYSNKTTDGVKINLSLNVGMDFDLDYIEPTKCDGIGLYRTEIPFMSASCMPDVQTQIGYYRKLLDAVKNKKVVFRSLDVGSDKLLPYWGNLSEENPAIGWRSIRITLDRRAILRRQMKAFLHAAAGRELNVMFPMIAGLEEFLEAKETLMIELEKEKRREENVPLKVNVGLMIEVPSVVFQLDDILKHADFVSVGTNDLAQFMFACDRGNPRISERYDVLSAPFLRVMREIVKKADKANVLCSVCGEMASNPLEALALIGLGYRRLSVAGSAFGAVKQMVRSIRVDDISEYMQALLKSPQKTLRPQLMAYAYDHGIAIL